MTNEEHYRRAAANAQRRVDEQIQAFGAADRSTVDQVARYTRLANAAA